MIRSTRNFEIIEEDNLVENATQTGKYLARQIDALVTEFPHLLSNHRGRGLLRAFSMPSPELRNKFTATAYNNGLMILGCGEKSIRFRPTLDVKTDDIDAGINIIRSILEKF
jgi:L-lysine 6-transaminase